MWNELTHMFNVSNLPHLRKGVTVHYEGSIDKLGNNADWDWWLYQQDNGEWVIMDVYGPGCLYNMVQHRYLSSSDPLFKFYFDGEEIPRFELHASEFGLKYPFVDNISGRYIGPANSGHSPIRVIRSFVPMPFTKSLKITSDVRLEGFERAKGQGGWGHVIWHSYNDVPPRASFSKEDDCSPLLSMLKKTGAYPGIKKGHSVRSFDRLVQPGEAISIFNEEDEGAIQAILLKVRGYNPEKMHDLWIRATWDNHKKPDVYVPFGCFFGNEWGEHSVQYLMFGMNTDGVMYNNYSMPFWKSAKIFIENHGDESAIMDYIEVTVNKEYPYDSKECGYFRSSDYYEKKHTEGSDSIIAHLKGTGHVVASVITGYGTYVGKVTCEGNVRVYIDGNLTPLVESDGSESYACYGWGFPTPPECNAFSGYDGHPDSPWSEVRTNIGDTLPFRESLVFGIQSGAANNDYMEHSGAVFYYGQDEVSILQTDMIDLKCEQDTIRHDVKGLSTVGRTLTSVFEGDADDVEVTDTVFDCDGALEFTCAIHRQNKGMRLRRCSDQIKGRQAARVFIDGELVAERIWYFADRNEHMRWLEDEMEISRHYTHNKEHVRIRIEPIDMDNGVVWNQAYYKVFSLL